MLVAQNWKMCVLAVGDAITFQNSIERIQRCDGAVLAYLSGNFCGDKRVNNKVTSQSPKC
jgi:hypothetical protein